MKILLSLLLSLSFGLSACTIKADKDYYVGDYINKDLYSHCKNISHLFLTSRYYISKNSLFELDSVKELETNNIIELPKKIKIHFKGRVVENIDGKIKVKDDKGILHVYNIKELLL